MPIKLNRKMVALDLINENIITLKSIKKNIISKNYEKSIEDWNYFIKNLSITYTAISNAFEIDKKHNPYKYKIVLGD